MGAAEGMCKGTSHLSLQQLGGMQCCGRDGQRRLGQARTKEPGKASRNNDTPVDKVGKAG